MIFFSQFQKIAETRRQQFFFKDPQDAEKSFVNKKISNIGKLILFKK